MPANKDLSNAKLQGADVSSCDLSGVDLRSADLRGANLSNANMKSVNLTTAKLHNARLPAWNSGLLEGVKLTGAEGWVPADKDLSKAKLKGADLSENDLSGVDFSSSDLQKANLKNSKLLDARLPAWSSGLLEGVNWSGARFGGSKWVPADKDLHDVKLKGADLSECDLSGVNLSASDLSCTLLSKANLSEANLKSTNLTNAKLHNACLPAWSSGLLEGVKLAGAEGWVPADKDLSNAKLKGADFSKAKLQGAVLKGADLSKCDLSGADLTGADLREAKLEGTNLRDATLCAALLHAAQGARPATTLPVPGSSGPWDCNGALCRNLGVRQPVVFALTAPRALTLQRVTLCNMFGDGQNDEWCAKEMEVQTGPSATGPWTSVVKFTSQKTKQEQTFAAAPDAPLLAGFVQVLVHDTYGGQAWVKSMALDGEGWG
jgi:uncharacterized protein YjbI with pentapeptide repeats